MRYLQIPIIIALLIWPVQTVISSIPDRPIFEHLGDGRLAFFNTHSDEHIEIRYKNKKGHYLDDGIDDIDYILRCRLTDKQIPISKKLIELIDYIQDHFDAHEIEIISGYRSPELNSSLRTSGRGVASRSRHLVGEAIDIRIPEVPLKELRDYAVSLKAGGIGFYPGPNFVHIDIGPVRYW